MKQLNNLDEEVYINVVFKIKRRSIVKLIDFLKQNTKTFKWWWEMRNKDEKIQD